MKLKNKTKAKILLGVMMLTPIFNLSGIVTEVNADPPSKEFKKQSEDHLDDWFNAVREGNAERVVELIESGVNVDTRDSNGFTALHYAAREGKKGIVKLLLKHGADIDVRTNGGYTALHVAEFEGKKDMVKFLLKCGAAINAKTNSGCTALHYAARKGKKDIVELLLAYGADINAKTNSGCTALHVAAENGRKDMVELLVHNGADINVQDDLGYTALHSAAQEGHKDIIELPEKRRDTSAPSTPRGVVRPRGDELLFGTVETSEPSAAAEVAPTPKRQNSDANASWFEVVRSGDVPAIQVMLGNKTDVNAKDSKGRTALHLAVRGVMKDLVKLLLSYGADVNIKDNKGSTALDLAKKYGYYDIFKLLKEARDKSAALAGKLSEHLVEEFFSAVIRGNIGRVAELIESGVNVDTRDNNGFTALHLAVRQKHTDIVRYLLCKGVDKDAKDNQFGLTALDLARKKGFDDIVELLLNHCASANE